MAVLAVRIIDGSPAVVDVAPPVGDGVRVRVTAAGICGSDLHLIDSGHAPTVTLGHEVSGLTDDGRRVAVEPILPCGTCDECRSGAYHLCAIAPFTMLGIGNDGGMAGELVVPERCLVLLDPAVDPAEGFLVEPIAVAVHGLDLAGWAPSMRTAVIGAGSIGCCAAATIVALGGSVDVACRHDHQRAAIDAVGGGAEVTDGYDVVVETAGTASALRAAARIVRPGGTLVLLSIHWDPTPGAGLPMWIKEVRVVHSMTYRGHAGHRDIDIAAGLLARSPGLGAAVITHRFPLDAAVEAFECARDRSAGAIKVVLEP